MTKSTKRAPIISQQLSPQNVEIGKSCTFFVKFTADKPAEIQWFKDGYLLTPNFEFQVMIRSLLNLRIFIGKLLKIIITYVNDFSDQNQNKVTL